jgi:Acyl-CoA reductase (LuxC)
LNFTALIMFLPNYFLADLPPEATLTPAILAEACDTLRRNREQYLANRSIQSLIANFVRIGTNWMDPDYPLRKFALQHGPEATGFPSGTLLKGLESFFSQLTTENFEALLEQDFGDARKLDQMSPIHAEQSTRRSSMVTAPELLFHITAGNLPIAAFSTILLGMLVRSAQIVKCATGTAFLPSLFAHSIYEVEPKLGACLEIAEWRGGNVALEETCIKNANCVTATGSDEVIAAIRHRVPQRKRFLGYGNRASFAFVGSDAISRRNEARTVSAAAADVIAWNQLGCLSPHVIYVESGVNSSPLQFAEALATELGQLEAVEPRGAVPAQVAAVIASRRGFYELRASASGETRLWCSKESTAWTVIYEADPRFKLSCLHRFIYVKGVKDLQEALRESDAIRERVSTVGIAVAEEQKPLVAAELARWGAPRVCPLGCMQNPPLTWRHDGRPSLGDLVTWTDWEH